MTVSHNGTEPTSRTILPWQEDHGVEWHHIAPASRCRMAMKSLNGGFRNECLSEDLFRGLTAARRVIEKWRLDYDEHRPHTSLRDRTPNESANRSRTEFSRA